LLKFHVSVPYCQKELLSYLLYNACSLNLWMYQRAITLKEGGGGGGGEEEEEEVVVVVVVEL